MPHDAIAFQAFVEPWLRAASADTAYLLLCDGFGGFVGLLATGTLPETDREACLAHVLRLALRVGGQDLLLLVARPEPEPLPTYADAALAERLAAVCDAIGLRFLDGLLVGRERTTSFGALGIPHDARTDEEGGVIDHVR